MGINGVGGTNTNIAGVYGARTPVRPERPAGGDAAAAAPTSVAERGLTPAQARRAVAAENAAAANPSIDDSTLNVLGILVRRAEAAAARPGARLDVRL